MVISEGGANEMLNAAGYIYDRYEVIESGLRDGQIVRTIRRTLNSRTQELKHSRSRRGNKNLAPNFASHHSRVLECLSA